MHAFVKLSMRLIEHYTVSCMRGWRYTSTYSGAGTVHKTIMSFMPQLHYCWRNSLWYTLDKRLRGAPASQLIALAVHCLTYPGPHSASYKTYMNRSVKFNSAVHC